MISWFLTRELLVEVLFAGSCQVQDGDAAQFAGDVEIAAQTTHLPRQIGYGRFGHFILLLVEQHVERAHLAKVRKTWACLVS